MTQNSKESSVESAENLNTGGDIDEKSAETVKKAPLKERIENFWYHYKWHSIVTVFVLIVMTVFTVQMCQRESYDVHVLYAGSHPIAHTSSDGDLPPYRNMITTLKKYAGDYNGDGEISVNLLDLFVMTSKEIDAMKDKDPDAEVNYTLIQQDYAALDSNVVYSDYYIIFISDELFFKYEEQYENALFAPLAPYTDPNGEYEFASERGIYLRSLSFYSQPEICNLPDNTVVCLRNLSEISATFSNNSEQLFLASEKMMKKILELK